MISRRDILLAKLAEHQAKAMAVIVRGDALLAVDAEPNPGLLSRSRWELTRILGAYQVFKHLEMFDPIIMQGTPEKARLAKKMKAECVALGEEYLAHVAHCTNLDIIAHWSSYRPTVAKLLAKIRAHLARERWVAESLLLTAVINKPVRSPLIMMNARGLTA